MAFGEFIAMGNYAAYIWSAYGFCLVVLILNLVHAVLRGRKIIRDLQKRLNRDKNRDTT